MFRAVTKNVGRVAKTVVGVAAGTTVSIVASEWAIERKRLAGADSKIQPILQNQKEAICLGELVNNSYAEKAVPVENYVPFTSEEYKKYGLIQNDGNGFKMDVYHTPDGNLAVAFRGSLTDMSNKEAWHNWFPTNFNNGFAVWGDTSEVKLAIEMTGILLKINPEGNLLALGHSMGANLAMRCVIAHDTPRMTSKGFNPSGVNTRLLYDLYPGKSAAQIDKIIAEKFSSRMVNYIDPKDGVYLANRLSGMFCGPEILLGEMNPIRIRYFKFVEALQRHAMDSMMKKMPRDEKAIEASKNFSSGEKEQA